MRRRLVIMVMIDALRHDYVTAADSPFLHSMAESGCAGSLAPSFGFEPDAAYFAGKTPEEADGGAQFWYRPEERLFRGVPLFNVLDRVPVRPWRSLVRKAVRGVAQALARDPLPRRMASPAQIPYDQLARFSLTLKHIADDPRAFMGESVFDYARAARLNTYFHGFPSHSVRTEVVLRRFLLECHGHHDFAFLFMGDLDGVGHRFGPESEERRAVQRRIDAALERMHTHAVACHSGVTLVVFGDHGMARVQGVVDVRPAIRAAGLDVERDTWFLDSTMARFWVIGEQRRDRLRAALGCIVGGHVITEGERAQYRIRYPHNAFGDVFFVVDDHLVVHPSFYADGEPPKGMHGYLPGCRDNESAFIVAGDGVQRRRAVHGADMRRIYTTVVELLGQSTPVARVAPSLLS